MEVEQNYCIYCKLPLHTISKTEYHESCQELIEKFNHGNFVKLKKFNLDHSENRKINWDQLRNKFYSFIYAVGGIHGFAIILIGIFLMLRK